MIQLLVILFCYSIKYLIHKILLILGIKSRNIEELV